jgi:hypothetical protein
MYLLYLNDARTSQETHTGLHGLLRRCLYFLYLDDVRISEETHLQPTTACYGDSFPSSFVVDVRTSLETQILSSTTCYGDSSAFTFFISPSLERREVSARTWFYIYIYIYMCVCVCTEMKYKVTLLDKVQVVPLKSASLLRGWQIGLEGRSGR